VPTERQPADSFEARARPAARARGRAPRLIALMFVAAFAASILTVIYTGLLVEAPRTRISAALPTVAMVVGENREVNLVFASSATVDDVVLLLTLPAGINLLGREGQRRVELRTRLVEGNNILPLTLIASTPAVGQLVARLRHGEDERVFRIHLNAVAG
jgi:hypothetical protein